MKNNGLDIHLTSVAVKPVETEKKCEVCLGFGLEDNTLGPEPVAIRKDQADKAVRENSGLLWKVCPECGSTINGIAKE